MKYSIEGNDTNVKVTVEDIGGKQSQLMEELKACAEGRCTCPTPQYAKVETMQISPGVGKVDITLTTKPGETIDQADITKCLEHTAKKLSQTS